MAKWSNGEGVGFTSFKEKQLVCGGNPAAYFTLVKRSPSTAAISRPSQTIAAEAFPWYALIPRIFIARFVSVPQSSVYAARCRRHHSFKTYKDHGRDQVVFPARKSVQTERTPRGPRYSPSA